MEINKRIRKIVNSIKEPSKECLWLRQGKLYYFGASGWTEIECENKVNIQDIIEATITQNGEVTITPSEGYDATLGVTVNVQVGSSSEYSDVDGMCYAYSKMTEFPTGWKLAPRTGTSCLHMFHDSSFHTVPQFDTSQVEFLNDMFSLCSSLTEIPQLNTSVATSASYMFRNCYNLVTVPRLDFSSVKENATSSIFDGCTKLTNIGGFIGLKSSLDVSESNYLTKESLLNIMNDAADVTQSTSGLAHRLTFGSTNLAKLTDEEKAIATNKGWTLA